VSSRKAIWLHEFDVDGFAGCILKRMSKRSRSTPSSRSAELTVSFELFNGEQFLVNMQIFYECIRCILEFIHRRNDLLSQAAVLKSNSDRNT
jgi:Sec7-like guanine-nucleotide exchange factor